MISNSGNFNCKAPKSLKGVLYTLLFFCFFSAQAQQPAPASKPAISELKGAELFTTFEGNGRIQVFLKVFYSCSAPVPANEYVSLFESMGVRLFAVLQLSKDTEFMQPTKTSVPCMTEKETCLKQVVYSVKKDLGPAYMDYDLSWGYCCFDRGVVNLDHTNKQGFALQIHLPNPVIAEPNIMSSLAALPELNFCNGTSTSFVLPIVNPDSDEVSLKLSQPWYYQASNQPDYRFEKTHLATLNQVKQNPMFAASFLTNNPPFDEVKYANGFTAEKNLPEGNFKLDAKTGKVDIKATGSGKYLTTITIQEKRNAKVISEHAALFIIEIR